MLQGGITMALKLFVRVTVTVAIVLVPVGLRAQAPVRLSGDDVLFQFAGVAEDTSHIGSKVATTKKASSNRLCGFQIRGNHRSRENPHVEWDMNIDEIVTPERSIAGVSAGTFDVTNHKRKPRAPITDLRFTLNEIREPIVAAIQGAPNADNAIVALIEAEPASRLFEEFQTMRPIVISIQYSDGTSDQIEVHGSRDDRFWGGGRNSYFNECLRGFRPKLQGEIATSVR
jgi:hypothetical protein